MNQIWNHKYNFARLVYEAFFCEVKSSGNKEFSTKKFWAFCLMMLAFCNHLELHLWPQTHWSVILSKKGAPESIVISLIASLDALAAWALGVYYKGKANGAA